MTDELSRARDARSSTARKPSRDGAPHAGEAPDDGRSHVARYHLLIAQMYRERGQEQSARFEEETARLIA